MLEAFAVDEKQGEALLRRQRAEKSDDRRIEIVFTFRVEQLAETRVVDLARATGSAWSRNSCSQ
ncbi:hypothetical protein AUC71_08475 [Methyloceanibacter marginalis]|uniref:Uncharacterized protein n=1 Tax=Methyloceanibacter marginalis TaxID=1774971 RepID=A0A1E3WF55_9HYPH|nr:hypothetical protein [Methyloceanibacter marginalis]ODS03657.1 hypothetical protein AUC71_08475 [Methyloceanibacter marginalis]